ncbi:MaoC family dehydratase [Flavobacterium sp. W21_SRS_FM6]|uniref:MaoC family dehydratase n=1 Tax=Flavobacterium sp. W21_SRS_FM6 TaxID=3240268 RepID=UPI003F9242B1
MMHKTLLELAIDEQLAPSEWIKITQADIDLFAEATGDHQWIHVDAQRCAKESPFKTTIAHGYLTVTLMPNAFYAMFAADPHYKTILNYGVDKIRFLEPVRVNDSIRFVSTLIKVEQKQSGCLFYFDTEAQIDGRTKPAMKGTFLMLLAGATLPQS